MRWQSVAPITDLLSWGGGIRRARRLCLGGRAGSILSFLGCLETRYDAIRRKWGKIQIIGHFLKAESFGWIGCLASSGSQQFRSSAVS